MSLEKFLSNAVSSWMNEEGPNSDIVLSSRVRLARNLTDYRFSTLYSSEEAKEIVDRVKEKLSSYPKDLGELEFLPTSEIQPLQKRVLMEKHLISPNLAEDTNYEIGRAHV